MVKPRKVGSLIDRILAKDPGATVNFMVNDEVPQLMVRFASAEAYTFSKATVELPIVVCGPAGPPYKFFVRWNCVDLMQGRKQSRAYSFGDDIAKRERRSISEQEEKAAELIGGRRHVGSGSLKGYKSDASSKVWQLEAKSTKAKSFSLKLSVLDKISREARQQDKKPIIHLNFARIPEGMIVLNDWVILPAEEFERMRTQ